jgi:ZIP family zinc transporter
MADFHFNTEMYNLGFFQTVFLGAIAGLTIYLGLPLGRIKGLSDGTRSFLSMTSAGILLFLLIDIFTKLSEPIQAAIIKTSVSSQFCWESLYSGLDWGCWV